MSGWARGMFLHIYRQPDKGYGNPWVWRAIFLSVGVVAMMTLTAHASEGAGHLLTVYDRGQVTTFVTQQETVQAALEEQNIELDDRDTVEPSRSEELVASSYDINIYRARPVIVIDGTTRVKSMTPFQTGKHIAKDAGIALYDEDVVRIERIDDIVSDGAGLEMTITRALPVQLDLYGNTTLVRTQGKTVGEFLEEKGIQLGDEGRVSPALGASITPNMSVRVWREGKQTVTQNQAIPYEVEQIFDADREIGYRAVEQAGVTGIRAVTYEIEIQGGVEISRQEIAQLVTKQAQKETVIVGVKPNARSLTKSKGAQYFTDSKGVSHRETYYDLPMNVVMGACGQGGYYTVRADGAKIDRAGYIIVAANYGNYPRCSVVETSLGPGKVYDTGGFAARHPYGFDLATDWTNNNGR